MRQSTINHKDIKADLTKVYEALTNPRALEIWQAPEGMKGQVHYFNLKVGGFYEMSLYYPETSTEKGKTVGNEDRFRSQFLDLIPNEKIIQKIFFDSPDPAFQGEMIMEITLEPIAIGTRVTIVFTNIPIGIKPSDNEAGTSSSLEKLARYVESE